MTTTGRWTLGLGFALLWGGCTQSPKAAGDKGEASAAASAAGKDEAKPAAVPQPSLDATTLGGTILFVSERDGNLEIYRWQATKPLERLTDDPRADFVAEVGPKGVGWTRVVTTDGAAPEDHREQLMWMPAGGEPVPFGVSGRRARGAAWTPDRSFVVYESDAEGAFSDIWRWAPGSAATRITTTEHGAFEPAVSPDGQQIAYVSTQDGNPELYVMSVEGGTPRRLTTWRRDDRTPRWSPDGTMLAFLRREQGGERLFVLSGLADADGQPLEKRLLATADGERVRHAEHTWTADGRRLVFEVQRPKQLSRVMVSDLEGNARVVSPTHLHATMPSLSPDGKRVAFAGTLDDPAALDIYVVELEGGAWAQLTRHAASDWLPRWSD
ncbi:MAG: hypothetical protein K0V04_06310 [Deltaproteobacteria bacterium]|nr:hypothetical protein [Deltaproteobacteria bacterium]